MTGGRNGRIRTEFNSSATQSAATQEDGASGRIGQNPIGLSARPPVRLGALPASGDLAPLAGGELVADEINSVLPSGSVLSLAVGGRGQPALAGASPVLRSPGANGSAFVFSDEAEAADFEERAAIRQFDGRLSKAAAERLAWLDVLKARDLAAQAQSDQSDPGQRRRTA